MNSTTRLLRHPWTWKKNTQNGNRVTGKHSWWICAFFRLPILMPNWCCRFSFCNHPFVLSTAAKGDILKIESMIQMRHELQDSFFRAMFIGVNSPYLQCKVALCPWVIYTLSMIVDRLVEVRRDHIIRDALYQVRLSGTKDYLDTLNTVSLE